MGLESEIERLFHEAQECDMEMLALSALPTYHSNYPSSPPPPGFENTSVKSIAGKTVKGPKGARPGKSKVTGTTKDRLQLSLDKDFFLPELLVLKKVDGEGALEMGHTRIGALERLHGDKYKDRLDDVSAATAHANAPPSKDDLEHALDHLKGESPNIPITIKVYDFEAPLVGGETEAVKVVITFQGCDYILEEMQARARDLEREGRLKVPVHGFADRWPERIEMKTETYERVYVRADIALPLHAKKAKKAAKAKTPPGPGSHGGTRVTLRRAGSKVQTTPAEN